MGDPMPQLSFEGNYSSAPRSLCLPSHCCFYCQTPAQDLVSPTELQKTEPKLTSKQIRGQKMTNRQVQHRGCQLFPSPSQTGLTENPNRKTQQSMASDKNGRKTQAASCYLFYLWSWIFSLPVTTSECLTLTEKSNAEPQEANREMPTPFFPVWCKLLMHTPYEPVYKGVKSPVGDAVDSWDEI